MGKKAFRMSVRGKLRLKFAVIALITALCAVYVGLEWYVAHARSLEARIHQWKELSFISLPAIPQLVWPPQSFQLGLDLKGGTHLVYEADVSGVSGTDRDSALEGARDVIERRINLFGVAEPVVQTVKVGEQRRVIVELAGVSDVSEAIKKIGDMPLLEFKTENPNPVPPSKELTDDQKKELEQFNNDARAHAESVLKQAREGGDFGELAKNFSADETTKEKGGDLGWVTAESQWKQLVDAVKADTAQTVHEKIIEGPDGLSIVKRGDMRDAQEIKARHLLICFKGAQSCTKDTSKEDARKAIEDLKRQTTPQNFEELAKKNSTEPGADTRGGDLGWFGRGVMVKSFENPAFALSKNAISDTVETQFGYHLIYKSDERTVTQYQLARILIPTRDQSYYQRPPDEWLASGLTGSQLKRAYVDFDPTTQAPQVGLEFDDEGKKLFGDLTTANVNKSIAIFLDNQPLSIPRVNEPIKEGKAVITGSFTPKDAKVLAQRLNTGALPVPIKLISQQTVGASLGSESLTKSLQAGLIGILLVAIFMILFYRLPGLIAVCALMIYTVLSLALFKLIPVPSADGFTYGITLSLAGIAGFILSVGMAVDANILIFERMREELRWGKNLDGSVRDGFARAWSSIRDSNVSSLITCFILFWFSASLIKGFALTLALGIAVSMLTAIIITRLFMELVIGWRIRTVGWLFNASQRKERES